VNARVKRSVRSNTHCFWQPNAHSRAELERHHPTLAQLPNKLWQLFERQRSAPPLPFARLLLHCPCRKKDGRGCFKRRASLHEPARKTSTGIDKSA
jgi:hypothetical protein